MLDLTDNLIVGENDERDEDSLGKGPFFTLEDFAGPLDVLLELVKKSKVPIEDVKISLLTEQYLDYLKNRDPDMDGETEFVLMAAYLLEIKSKSLLPRPIIIDEDEENPEQRLRQQLAAYALYKDVSKKMKDIETVGILFRPPDESVGKPHFILKEFDADSLTEALKKVFIKLGQRAESNIERHIIKDRFTVEEKIAHIKDAFTVTDRCGFNLLFEEGYTKSEIITTFLAILELIKMQFLRVIQADTYSEIFLERAESDGEQSNEILPDTYL